MGPWPAVTVRRATLDDAEGIADCMEVLGYSTEPSVVRDKLDAMAGSAAAAAVISSP